MAFILPACTSMFLYSASKWLNIMGLNVIYCTRIVFICYQFNFIFTTKPLVII
jgi:hypothetical protein